MLVYDVHIFYYFSIYWSDTSLEVGINGLMMNTRGPL